MLSVKNLFFTYLDSSSNGENSILKDISFTLQEGEKILILGESESGKTTLSFLLSGLSIDGKRSGEIFYDGNSITPGKVALVPQNTNEYIIEPRVEDEIAFPLENISTPILEMEERVSSSLSEWGLESLKDASPDRLSGGEKRRLLIATALSTNPKYVVYDEAFDDLDLSWREKLKERILSQKEASIVFSSRFLDYFDNLFDRIYLLKGGILTPWRGEKERINRPIIKESDKKHTITVKALKYSFSPSSRKPFSLEVDNFLLKSNEITALLGPNGSGKTTFSHLLCGLYKREKGDICYDSAIANEKTLLRLVGYVFQNPDYQIFLPTVKDELMYSLNFLPLDKKEKLKEVERVCSLFSLNPDSIASIMGYGERKRLQCAIYYTLNRPFYIVDELDSALTYQMCTDILTLLLSRGAGILLITHDDDLAKAVSTRKYRAKEGTINEE